MAQQPPSPTGALPPTARERFLRLAATPATLSDANLLNEVFSGGYYVILTSEEYATAATGTRIQQKRNQKSEEALRLANLTRQLYDEISQPVASATKNTPPASRHDYLLSELQSLINRSDLVQNNHHEHLSHEIQVARQQLLRGGAIDDFALMQLLQEIAGLQGLSLAGSTSAGRFSSDIIDRPEHEAEKPLNPAEPTPEPLPFLGATPFAYDREDYLQREYDHFSAYDISEVGGCSHHNSFFFAHKIMESLLETDSHKEPVASTSEIVP